MNPSIPEEIVIQIFTWFPVKSLMRFKCVTKFFNSLVFESYFMDIHTSQSMIRQSGTKYFLDRKEFYEFGDGKISASNLWSFDEFPFYIPVGSDVSCVNGLFCIQKPAAILNPSTGEVRYLPKLNDDQSLLYYWLGFELEENKYKVLLTRDGSGLYLKQCVFTLGIDKSWRKTQRIPRSVMYKPGNSSKWWYYELIEVKGKLAIINCPKWSCEYFHLWVSGQIQKEEEWKSHIIHFPSMWKHLPPKIIPHCNDIARQSWRNLEIKGLPTNHCIRGIYSYIERLANSASGIAVSDECKMNFSELKTKRNHRYIVFKIDNSMHQVVVEKVGRHDETHEDFANESPDN
ncbi:hypothetical protein H5410_001266 [Solanum commersonii]|uniref:F-box domain-containing protein n=1 Tax=Solanum commersonii TaxID=4109 RepID=A0A9J6AY74_SOLCO|nr:hypothetical protein H5410_001266 [Solanum commersonii]